MELLFELERNAIASGKSIPIRERTSFYLEKKAREARQKNESLSNRMSRLGRDRYPKI